MKEVLIELKAKVEDLNPLRGKLEQLHAEHVGVLNQADTYYRAQRGRLKVRETEGLDTVDIVWYEREDVPEIKRSEILLVKATPIESAKELLSQLLPIIEIVRKTREVYRLEEMRVHLDRVSLLGSFLEFERPTLDDPEHIEQSRMVLNGLLTELGVNKTELVGPSYIDLLLNRVSHENGKPA